MRLAVRMNGFLQVTPPSNADIRAAARGTGMNMAIFAVVVYLLSLSKLKDALGESTVTLGSVSAVVGSFAHLVYKTCKLYPVDGKWIMGHFCGVGAFVFLMVEASGVCSPGMQLMTKFIILHAAMLTMRLSFDVNHAFGARFVE